MLSFFVQDALQGRENPLPFVDLLATLSVLESDVEQELLIQFNVKSYSASLVSHEIKDPCIFYCHRSWRDLIPSKSQN